ncbi:MULTISPECIES: WGR domain-containing protein [unclassified Bradyrhizobium]|uniref:WGR domain-containing protein n=1 Tax=unclassified Bradyrhizobium TaxID=2631580 RepID=UPI00244B6C20|nr:MULTISPECIES: WGR domain-containing protein [unclassified Bradyrhizobium]MDH2344196.1 WGR domain-containing protein [Bradyrhizobium sp. SSUT77]MDH2356873.1 WGR domain-containing protein [Bradyrhizobium sp. SSUT112]
MALVDSTAPHDRADRDTALLREWGRVGQRGRRRLGLFAGPVQAIASPEAWLERKARHG